MYFILRIFFVIGSPVKCWTANRDELYFVGCARDRRLIRGAHATATTAQRERAHKLCGRPL